MIVFYDFGRGAKTPLVTEHSLPVFDGQERKMGDRTVFVAHANTPAARDDKVHLVLGVGLLTVGLPGGPHGPSQAQQLAHDKVFVGLDSWFAR